MKMIPKMEICNIVGGIVYYLKKLLMTPHLDSHNTTDSKPESYQLFKPKIEFHVMEEMYVALHIWALLASRDKNLQEMWKLQFCNRCTL